MERWDNKSLSKDQISRYRKENPSFSSTLLDAIYRSIDEGGGGGEEEKGLEEMVFSKEILKKKEGVGSNVKEEAKKLASYEKACMIEKWMMEKKASEKVFSPRKSMENIGLSSRKDWNPKLINSSSSSSDSSSGGGFSSSESDSIIYGANSRSSSYKIQRPKPIRTSASTRSEMTERTQLDGYSAHNYHHERNRNTVQGQKSKHHDLGSFMKSKSKALKLYGDLKKGNKQPISPGGRLASFLNSLFTAGSNSKKKAKISKSTSGGYSDDRNNTSVSDLKSKSGYESTCSSASSFSRSCLSKNPSSRGKLSNDGTKRSVRFYPVSVIVDEDCQPCGEKNLHENKPIVVSPLVTTSSRSSSTHKDVKFNIMEENSRLVEDVAREILTKYQKKNENYTMKNDVIIGDVESEEEEEDDDDDDAASYSSSDLFELDNLSAIGIERYREELPVYETTHIDTNRAIASGLIV